MAIREPEIPRNDRTRPDLLAGVEAARIASECSARDMALLLYSSDTDVLLALLANPQFGEGEALVLLNRRDLPRPVVQALANVDTLVNVYAVKLALAKHPRTPLRTALEQLKFLYLFDLVAVCLRPGVLAEVKRVSEELILAQLPKLAIGQRITLARRGSARLAASLLIGENRQITSAVLDNPYLTEAALLSVLSRPDCPEGVVQCIAGHAKWGLRYDIRLALLRNSSLPFAQALLILPYLKARDIDAMSQDPSVLPEVRKALENRLKYSKT